MSAQAFPTLDVIGAACGVVLRENGVGGLYAVLNFATGQTLYTHQLPRAGRNLQRILDRDRPELAKAIAYAQEHAAGPGYRDVADKLLRRFGETIEIEPFGADDFQRMDPIAELETIYAQFEQKDAAA